MFLIKLIRGLIRAIIGVLDQQLKNVSFCDP